MFGIIIKKIMKKRLYILLLGFLIIVSLCSCSETDEDINYDDCTCFCALYRTYAPDHNVGTWSNTFIIEDTNNKCEHAIDSLMQYVQANADILITNASGAEPQGMTIITRCFHPFDK
jgi:hypothetical protein